MNTAEIRAERYPLGARVTISQLEESPHEIIRELRAHEPVSWLPAVGGWFVTARALAIEVLRDADAFTVDDPRFSTAQVLGPSMLSLDGADHDRHRAPFIDAFRQSEIRRSYPAFVRDEARRLVSDLRSRGTAELRQELAGPLAVSVITEALGLNGVDPATVLSWYSAIVADVSRITAGEMPSTGGAAAFAEIREAVRSTVAEVPASLLAAVAGDGSLDDAELAANVGVLMFGAIETSEGMTANLLHHLLSHPVELDRARDRPGIIPKAVEESLRLEPAAAVVDRYATRDIDLGDASIMGGDPVTVSLAGANRDPDTFEDPDRFDVLRENARVHISFVPGPHTCLGMHLARLETIAAIEAVVELLPDIQLDDSRSSPPRGLVFRKPPSVVAMWPVDQ
jgi:cytochrome P450